MGAEVVGIAVVRIKTDKWSPLELARKPSCECRSGIVQSGSARPPWVMFEGPALGLAPSTESICVLGLPLWWDGALVEAGYDHARRIWAVRMRCGPNEWSGVPNRTEVWGLALRLLETGSLDLAVQVERVEDGALRIVEVVRGPSMAGVS